MKTIIPWLLIVSTLLAYSKDETITPECPGGDCLPFEVQNFNVCFPGVLSFEPCDYYTVLDTLNYSAPVFSPHNSDEIGFMFNKVFSYGGGVDQICCIKFIVYNHRTNTKISEYDFPITEYPHSQPEWSIYNELIYSGLDLNIHKLNLEDQELSVLAIGKNPKWNYEGNKLVYTIPQDIVPYISNREGTLIDTLTFPAQLTLDDWSDPSNKLLYDFGYYNFETQIDSSDFLEGTGLNMFYKKWGATDKKIVIIDDDDGLGIYDIPSAKFNLIKSNCSGKYYGQLAVSRDKKYIASVVSKWTIISEDSLFMSPQIRIMNMDGSDERVLNIEI